MVNLFKVKDAWMIKNFKLIKGKGFQADNFNDGTSIYKDRKFFIDSEGTMFNENWTTEIFFSEDEAISSVRASSKKHKEFLKNQIKDYTKRLKELGD